MAADTSVEESKSDGDADEVPSRESMKPKKTPTEQMKANLEMLVHACQCDNSLCALAACKKMKVHVNHCKECEYQTNGGCSYCRTLFVLCSYHAKGCHQTNCSVVNCMRIKEKMKQRR